MGPRTGASQWLLFGVCAASPLCASACAPTRSAAPPSQIPAAERPTVVTAPALSWRRAPTLPRPRTNNAVAVVPSGDRPSVYSMMGLGPGRTHEDIVRDSWVLQVGSPRWDLGPSVPGPRGRLAATAEVLDGKVYLVGGYTVAPDGTEVSVPDVDMFDPQTQTWSKSMPMPVPVDDALSVVWRGRLILVSGWHDRDNVTDVQLFDPKLSTWTSLPPIPGTPVFGHAGGVVGDDLVYCDGVGVDREHEPPFCAVAECHHASLVAEDPRSSVWEALPHHGHAARYRMAADALGTRRWVVFAGGTDHPYNYNGVGYDGRPAHPQRDVFAWDANDGQWIDLPPLPVASMDHRGLVAVGDTLWLIGGMADGGEVVPDVWVLGPTR